MNDFVSIAVTLPAMDSLVQKHTVAQYVNTLHIKLEHTLAKLRTITTTKTTKIITIIIIIIIIHATRPISNHSSNYRDNWNHVKILQKIPEQRTEVARNKEATDNSHPGHCTQTWERSNAYLRNIQHGKSIHLPKSVTEEQLQHYTLEG